MEIVPAYSHQAEELAYLINLAGEGIPCYLWSGMAEPGETAMDVGIRRAGREEGGFSYRNARVVLDGNDGVQGMIIAYRLQDPYPLDDLDDYPALLRPLVELEAEAPGSFYINAIATIEACRGQGVGQRLIADAELRAREAECDQISLIVASENRPAFTLYEYLGYRVKSTKPVISYPGAIHGGDWVLMVKSI